MRTVIASPGRATADACTVEDVTRGAVENCTDDLTAGAPRSTVLVLLKRFQPCS
jgi:hypothetical protein